MEENIVMPIQAIHGKVPSHQFKLPMERYNLPIQVFHGKIQLSKQSKLSIKRYYLPIKDIHEQVLFTNPSYPSKGTTYQSKLSMKSEKPEISNGTRRLAERVLRRPLFAHLHPFGHLLLGEKTLDRQLMWPISIEFGGFACN
uniref:Uncharacterized protein n=1 Tax=Solanum tuberosum TaxID=4113 RepID=M1DIQ7_SOLTU